MTTSRETLAVLIDNLAYQTGASEAVVERTRHAFVARGISLEADAGPYFTLLADTFRREETARRGQEKTLEGLQRLQDAIAAWQTRQNQLIAKLRAISEQLDTRNGTAG